MATTTAKRAKESSPASEPEIGSAASAEDLMARIAALEARVDELEEMPARDTEDRLAMVVFSGNMDRTIAAFIIATGAVAMGMEVSMFFTFWGLSIIKKQKRYLHKNFLQKAFTAMLPAGTTRLGLSQKNFMGAGARIMRKMMRDHNVTSVEELVQLAQEFGVRMVACDMTRELMGISDEEMMDGVEKGGVATFLGDAARAKVSLFI
ncbi:MAG TPA: DsrE/DsrF/DrsH-like family protein [Burkholderiales bacterium]|nr:DsrE/DsrF/DrsH-like family protein [Burkholderiales bacterium]